MTSINLLVCSSLIVALASCAAQKDEYDTSNPYGTPDYGSPYQPVEPVNPTYDTPAAYEESSSSSSSSVASGSSSSPSASSTVHTIVKGDTLWGISRKYNVTVDALKRANNLTSDTVVLGRKLIIPAR